MADSSKFLQTINDAYQFHGESFFAGIGMFDGRVVDKAIVNIPLKTMNRHGLIAGATGTGKTKTLQMLAEGLSNASVPVVLMDIKGDLSGIAAAGTASEKINDRCKLLGMEYAPAAFPVEFLSLSKQKGTRLRATVSEFGPVLLSRILGLNDTQESFVAMIFKYCDDHKMPLVDLKDMIKVMQFASNEGKAELTKDYGNISTASLGTILRKVIELQQQGADLFFGETSFEVDDLLRIDENGRGMISVIRVTDLQDRPKLFSTFMLQLLAELYASCPEEGDADKPKLVIFIDEAHLIFNEASDALLQQIETIVKLIRSKGIGIFFCTQNPMDIPAAVLAQLGMKVQHALRAFTAADRKTIKQIVENYPETEFYDTDELLTAMGIGEALITLLNEKGIPSALVHTMMAPPKSRMDILTESEMDAIISKSLLVAKYEKPVDERSAYEILTEKLNNAADTKTEEKSKETREDKEKEKGFFDDPIVKSMARTAGNTIVRSLLGVLGLGGSRRRRSLF